MPPKKDASARKEEQKGLADLLQKYSNRLQAVILNDFTYSLKGIPSLFYSVNQWIIGNTTSLENSIKWVYRCNARSCDVFLHIAVDFDFAKHLSNKPNVLKPDDLHLLAFSSNRIPFMTRPPDQSVIHALNWPHTCVQVPSEPIKISINRVQNAKMDNEFFLTRLKADPYADLEELKKYATSQNKSFKEPTLRKLILDFRKQKFPNDIAQILNIDYCKTLDPDPAEKLIFYQGGGEVLDAKGKLQRFVVLGTKAGIRILARSKTWFLDGTFKVVPQDYKQVYVWISKYDEHNVPCLFLLLTSKSEILYTQAFSHIKCLFMAYGFKIDSKYAMLDYEKAARNAIKSNFPMIELKEDYFHFCKCLWVNAKKHSLCEETLLQDTCVLIAFFKMLIHMEKNVRMDFFKETKDCFLLKNTKFKDFIEYFKTNWLETAFIDFKSLNKEELEERTNNICEGFNHMYNKHIGLRKARLAMFICKLLDLELYYRKRMLKKIGQGEAISHFEEDKEKKLPFSDIFHYLHQHEKDIGGSRYSLRSGGLESAFIMTVADLNRNCHNYFFSEDLPEDSEEMEKNEKGKI